eukprot:129461-Pleurochrysis_carterae.AAC.1
MAVSRRRKRNLQVGQVRTVCTATGSTFLAPPVSPNRIRAFSKATSKLNTRIQERIRVKIECVK